MSEIFNRALNLILDHEGGYVNDPKDPGGETNFGISKRAYPHLNIRDLTKAQAAEIYRKDYWNKIRGDSIDPSVAIVAFDIAVNMGVSVAIKMLQYAVDERQDGIFGDKTFAGINCHASAFIVERMTTARIMRYASLSTFNRFGSGWIRRSVETLVFAMEINRRGL